MDCSLPGSSVHGIFQARVLEWVAIAFSVRRQMVAKKKKKKGGGAQRAKKEGEKKTEKNVRET